MSKIIALSMLGALATFAVAAPLTAQGRSTVNVATLDAAVTAHPANNRAIVTAALSSDKVTAIAGRMGITRDQLAARVAALDDASAQQVADRILAGGSDIVIGTGTVIIILLLIILLTR